MMTFVLFLIAGGVSLGAIFLLRTGDEKRLRLSGRVGTPTSSRMRALLWSAVIAPGVALLIASQFSAFLSWFGLLNVAGWLIAAQGAEAKAGRGSTPSTKRRFIGRSMS